MPDELTTELMQVIERIANYATESAAGELGYYQKERERESIARQLAAIIKQTRV